MYILRKYKPEEREYVVTITGDINDSDYITNYESYTQEEFDEIADELNCLEENFSERHKLLEYNNYKDLPIPRHTNEDCHTLISVDIMMYEPNGSAYIVMFE